MNACAGGTSRGARALQHGKSQFLRAASAQEQICEVQELRATTLGLRRTLRHLGGDTLDREAFVENWPEVVEHMRRRVLEAMRPIVHEWRARLVARGRPGVCDPCLDSVEAVQHDIQLEPRSFLSFARPHALVEASPEWIVAEGLSDHPPVVVAWPTAFRMPDAQRPVPRQRRGGCDDAGGVAPQVGSGPAHALTARWWCGGASTRPSSAQCSHARGDCATMGGSESGKGLGVYLGPNAGEQSWASAQAKWAERWHDLARRSMPAGALATLCAES